jgi:hypothetical protein
MTEISVEYCHLRQVRVRFFDLNQKLRIIFCGSLASRVDDARERTFGCAECHAIQKEYARSPNANAPRFQAIASTPGMTPIALSAALNTSHHSMPNILLAADQQADIIAYILSLK